MNPRRLVPLMLALFACGDPKPAAGPVPAPTDDSGTAEAAAVEEDAGRTPDASGPIELASAPVDLLFVVDRSESWTRRSDRFAGMRDALEAFVAAHADPFAVSVFPKSTGDACAAASYDALDLPFAATPTALGTLLDGIAFGGESTLGPALASVGATARAHAKVDRHRTTAIVLLTDASPGDDEACTPETLPEIADLSAKTFDLGHAGGAQVHVLSVMGIAVHPDHAPMLGAIASKGGGYAAFVNGSREDVAKSARTALEDMRDRMLTCTRILPDGIPPESLEVAFPDGATSVAPRVADASACTSTAGFYVDDPDHPSTATLCGGEGGVGGYCELTFLRARAVGAPSIRALR